ncbi:hypothetical protein BDV30DRAFT_221560 [Aspergillus minisclerotigenes]|uniref:Uncharacterized protein n=1 Tax=Aspergillus minisclerotigenes TaxID=656917 RepID=A0A5N6IJV3_9EURO|nr:hypothetical protein BDV30DRAFT_221560 [Aspergillus minisclerotigenes]
MAPFLFSVRYFHCLYACMVTAFLFSSFLFSVSTGVTFGLITPSRAPDVDNLRASEMCRTCSSHLA